MDQLISSVMRGDFGLENDEESNNRRTRIVPVRKKPEPVEPEPAPENSEETPAEPVVEKKPRKVFKFPKASDEPEDPLELEAKLTARVMRDIEIEAEEEAQKQFEAEERARKSTVKKIAIPKAFDGSGQSDTKPETESQKDSEPQPGIQAGDGDSTTTTESSQTTQTKVAQQPEGQLQSKVSLEAVEALLETDDFDALEKLYDDYWG